MSEAVLMLEADTGRHRAFVYRLSERMFRIEVERLIQADDAEFWSAIPGVCSYADSLERAEELAAENLRWGQALEP